jgi:hypothetical protein
MTTLVTYRKGPLGYAVLLVGKPVWLIRDVRNMDCGWQVSVPGLNSTDAMRRGSFRGETLFSKFASAKAAVERVLS